MQVANTSHIVQRVKAKDGSYHEIEPGEARPVDCDKADPEVVALVNAQVIHLGGTEAEAKKAAREKSPSGVGEAPAA